MCWRTGWSVDCVRLGGACACAGGCRSQQLHNLLTVDSLNNLRRGRLWMRCASCVKSTVGGVKPPQRRCNGLWRQRQQAADGNTPASRGEGRVRAPRRHAAVGNYCGKSSANAAAYARAARTSRVKWVHPTLYTMYPQKIPVFRAFPDHHSASYG